MPTVQERDREALQDLGLLSLLRHRGLWVGMLISYLIFFGLWQASSLVMGNFLMPSPGETFGSIGSILSRWSLARHVLITFYRTVAGVFISALVGLFIVLLARYFSPIRVFFLSLVYPVVRAIPVVSVALLAVVWFKLGDGSVMFVVLIAVLPIYLIGLWEGLKVLDASLVEMARAISPREGLIFRKLIFPMLIPCLFSSTKLGFSVAFKLALVGEVLAAVDGMGYMLQHALQEYRTNQVFAWTFIVIAFVIFFDYYLFDWAERRWLYKWESEF
ncbi:MAG: ABC transporter permease subunit [Candidatus Tectomicrobia bacterium]|nr:ABC transporter permease subunit [Candidatus Tectomicrobia bacterium]